MAIKEGRLSVNNSLDNDEYFEFAVKKLKEIQYLKFSHNTTHTTHYGGVGPKVNSHYAYICHSQIARLPGGTSIIYSKFGNRCFNQRAGDAWLEWITSDDSPWRISMEMGMSFRDPKKFCTDYWRNSGFIFDKLDVIPSNVMMQFLIASRQASEHPKIIERWYEWTQEGLSPEMALVMSCIFSCHGERKDFVILNTTDYGDWMLNAVAGTEKYIKNFLEHRMDKKLFKEPYINNHNYIPVNALWGPEGQSIGNYKYQGCYGHKDGYADLDHFTIGQLYRKDFGKLDKVNTFYGDTKIWKLRFEEIVEIGKAEEKRFAKMDKAA